MVVVLHPATLRFSDSVLEKEYASYRKAGTLFIAEDSFLRLNFLFYILFVFSEVLSGGFAWNLGFRLKLLGCVLTLCHAGVVRVLSNETRARHQFLVISFFRTVRLLLFLVSVRLWVNDPIADARSMFKIAVLRTGLLVNMWYALGFPLLFAEHLILHSIHVIMTLLATSPSACAAIQESTASQQLLNEVWNRVNDVLTSLAGMPGHPLHQRELASTSASVQLLPHACEMLLIVAQLTVSFALPTYLLWNMEVMSRRSYVEDKNRHSHLERVELDCTWLPDTARILGTSPHHTPQARTYIRSTTCTHRHHPSWILHTHKQQQCLLFSSVWHCEHISMLDVNVASMSKGQK